MKPTAIGEAVTSHPAEGRRVPALHAAGDTATVSTLRTGRRPGDLPLDGTIEWEVGAIRHVLAGAGSDRITGNSADNDIYGVSGADTIFGGGGDDEIRVRYGSGGDVVDCGEAFIGSDDGDQIDPNCENEVPAS